MWAFRVVGFRVLVSRVLRIQGLRDLGRTCRNSMCRNTILGHFGLLRFEALLHVQACIYTHENTVM